MRNNLKQFRADAGMTQQDLESISGVTRQGISLIELNNSRPWLSSAYSIARALNKTVYEIWPDELGDKP